MIRWPWVRLDDRLTLPALIRALNERLGRLSQTFTETQGQRLRARSLTANGTLVVTDGVLLCDATAGQISLVLPAAAAVEGRVYRVKKTDGTSAKVAVQPSGAETIDGLTEYAIVSQYESVTIMAVSGSWHVL